MSSIKEIRTVNELRGITMKPEIRIVADQIRIPFKYARFLFVLLNKQSRQTHFGTPCRYLAAIIARIY